MNDQETEQLIRSYLPEIVHLSLSTAKDNKPWTSEVHYAYDDNLNLYFLTRPDRRHSEEIAENAQVSGAITKQHGIGEAPQGIYFEGTAQKIEPDDDDYRHAYDMYRMRFDTPTDWLDEEAQKAGGHRFYKIRVSDYYVFDAVTSKPSQKYHLKWQ